MVGDRKGKGRAETQGEESDEDGGEGDRMLGGKRRVSSPNGGMEYDEAELDEPPSSSTKEKWLDLRNLLFEVRPTILLPHQA